MTLKFGTFDPANSRYATDGKCHNVNNGTFGHECGKPAAFIGSKRNGFRSGFCALCRDNGDEARQFVTWAVAA